MQTQKIHDDYRIKNSNTEIQSIWFRGKNCDKTRAFNLSLKRYRIPISSGQGEFPTANPSQNLFRCIFWAISEWSEAEGWIRIVSFQNDMNIVFEINHD